MFSKSLTNCEKSWINLENKLHKEKIEIVKEKAQVICQNFLWTTWVKSQSKTKEWSVKNQNQYSCKKIHTICMQHVSTSVGQVS
jgi:thiamine kinase-like enzyme